MKLWADFYDYYLNDLQGCSYLTAANALRMAAQEFCERTKCWRVTMAPIAMLADTTSYSFAYTAELEVSQVLEVKLDDQEISNLTRDQEDGQLPGLFARTNRDFTINPVPAAGQQLVVKAILRPGNASTGVEDFIYFAHAEAIAKGARSRLQSMTNQPFSNPRAAGEARDDFERMIGTAIVAVARAHSRAPLRSDAHFM
jgi:hypothetical protein